MKVKTKYTFTDTKSEKVTIHEDQTNDEILVATTDKQKALNFHSSDACLLFVIAKRC